MTREELKKKLKLFLDNISKTYPSVAIKKDKLLLEKVLYYTKNLDKFTDVLLIERIYCILNDFYDRPKCHNCNKSYVKFTRLNSGYQKYCSNKCHINCFEKKEKIHKSKLNNIDDKGLNSYQRVGQKNKFILKTKTKEEMKKIKNKEKQTKLNNIDENGLNSYQRASIKHSKTWHNKAEEEKDKIILDIKNSIFNKYGTFWFVKSKEYKDLYKNKDWLKKKQEKEVQTCLKKYRINRYFQSNEYKDLYKNKDWLKKKQEKEYKTKKKNNSFNSSKPQKILEKELRILYPDLISEYKDERYPFCCDFYIPSKDLFIELNLHWTHGKELFDECDEDHKLILEEWKERSKKSRFYVNAIYVWTNLDVRKRKIVKKNKLNYLVFYSRDYHKKDGLKNIIETIKNF